MTHILTLQPFVLQPFFIHSGVFSNSQNHENLGFSLKLNTVIAVFSIWVYL